MSIKEGKVASVQLASFGLKAHSSGVRLPSGRFNTLAETLSEQWTEFARQQIGPSDRIAATLYLRSTESALEVALGCEAEIPTLRLKPVVEALNAASAGMGWLVAKAVDSLVTDHFPVHTPAAVRWAAEHVWHRGWTTDEDLMEELRQDLSAEEAAEVKTLQDFKDLFGFPWPSDFDADVEGHTFLFGGAPWPKLPSRAAAQAFVRDQSIVPALRACVNDALAVLKDTRRKNHPCSVFTTPDEMSVGTTCLVVWDDDHTAIETLEHHEQQCFESGEGSEIQFTYSAPLDDDAAITRLVQQTKALVKRFALASRLLSHLPEAR